MTTSTPWWRWPPQLPQQLYNDKEKGCKDENQPKQHIWRRLGSGEFYLFSLVLFDANKCFTVSTGCIYDIHEREWVGRLDINNFILLQTKLLLYNSSITVTPPQSRHRRKQGAGRGKSKETAGEGNRGSRRVASWAQVCFFLFHSSNMLTDTIVPWRQWWLPAHPHTITTPILHPSEMATCWRAGGGLEMHRVSSPWYVFFFIYYYYTTTYLAWNEPMNGQNEMEMGGAQDIMRLEPLVCFLFYILLLHI